MHIWAGMLPILFCRYHKCQAGTINVKLDSLYYRMQFCDAGPCPGFFCGGCRPSSAGKGPAALPQPWGQPCAAFGGCRARIAPKRMPPPSGSGRASPTNSGSGQAARIHWRIALRGGGTRNRLGGFLIPAGEAPPPLTDDKKALVCRRRGRWELKSRLVAVRALVF